MLQQIAEAEKVRGRPEEGAGGEKGGPGQGRGVTDQNLSDLSKEFNKQMLEDASVSGKQKEELQRMFDELMTAAGSLKSFGVEKEDCKLLKEKVFGANSFWVTEMVPDGALEDGMLFKGNLRGKDKRAVYEELCAGMRELFGEKYELLMVEDPDATEDDSRGGPRVAFLLLQAAAAQPPDYTRLQASVAVLLAAASLFTCLFVGISAEISLVPKDVITAFLRPEDFSSEEYRQIVTSWDTSALQAAVLPFGFSLFGLNLAHDLGHRMMAAFRDVKLSPPYFIPSNQIGIFGSISQTKSLIKGPEDLFDIAYAGLAAGGAVSSALFLGGLLLTPGAEAPATDAAAAGAGLVAVPSVLFKGSLLLGGISQLGLGGDALEQATVMVHPFLVVGWCGLVMTALNALPVGALDGGKLAQSMFGRKGLSLTSLLSYAGLGFGFLGSTLALPFGLYVLICQRTPEQFLKDSVTRVDERRMQLGLAVILFATLTLAPMTTGSDISDLAGTLSTTIEGLE